MMSRRSILLGLLATVGIAVVAVILLTGGADAAPEEVVEAPAGTPTAVPTVSPLPPLQLERVPVRWEPVPDLFDFDAAVEIDDPFARFFGEVAARWDVYVAEAGSPSKQVFSTGRWVEGLTWDDDGVQIAARTLRSVPSTVGPVTTYWRVTTTIDPSSGAPRDAYAPFPFLSCNDCRRPPGSADEGPVVAPNPDGDLLLVTIIYDNGINDLSRTPWLMSDAYLVDGNGTRKLTGVPGVWQLSWLMPGINLVGSAGSGYNDYGDRYIIPLEDGEAVVIRNSRALSQRDDGGNPSRSLDSRAVFVYSDAENPAGVGNYLSVYDSTTGQAWSLGKAPQGTNFTSSDQLRTPISWRGDDVVLVGDGSDAAFIDLGTGTRRPATRDDWQPQGPTGPTEYESPDGRQVVYYESREPFEGMSECNGLPYKLILRDLQTGSEKPLLECNTDRRGRATWLSDTKLVASVYNCSGCGHPDATAVLIDIERGQVLKLTDEPDGFARVYVSPDKKKFAVTGSSVRVYDDLGRLLRDYGAPPSGTGILGVVWSPDSKSFAYLIGPEFI